VPHKISHINLSGCALQPVSQVKTMSGQIHFLKTDGADLISYRLESKNLCLLIFTNSDIIRGHGQKRIH